MQLLDIFCEALNPDFYHSMFSDYFVGGGKDSTSCSPVNQGLHSRDPGRCFGHARGSFIVQALRKMRDLPGGSLSRLLQIWGKLTEEMPEVNHNLKELQSALRCEDADKNLKHRALDSRE
ncbi:Origin recognition complex subunit 3 [Asimina triloba]